MTLSLSSSTILLLALFPAIAHGFLPPQTYTPSTAVTTTSLLPRKSCCFMSPSDDDSDEDESIDPNSLGDWRAFRMNLANTDIASSSSTSSIDGIDLEESSTDSSTLVGDVSSATTSSSTTSKPSRPKSVSEKNEQLLNSQSAALAEEYLNGVWAHESAIPEVGGLVCRLPLEAEIYRGSPDSTIYKKLQSFLDSEDYDRTEDSIPTSLSSSASTGGAASASVVSSTSNTSRSGTISSSDDDFAFSPLAAKTVFWYRGAEKLLKRELENIMSNANENGKIDANDLDEETLELLQLYVDHQNTWQEVGLVIEKDEKTGSSKTLAINRPMAFKLTESLGRLVLLGAAFAEEGGALINLQEGNGVETQNVVKFLSAFENECGVYVGGPDDMDKPAIMIHGMDDLEGAVEISPGTGIYRGGLEAAMDGVMSGKYKPLDFRFFVGHTSYVGGELDDAVSESKYQPVACSRPLVLKQCIQLPKPLWHEVLEFCGGELKEISKLELTKRDDLQ